VRFIAEPVEESRRCRVELELGTGRES